MTFKYSSNILLFLSFFHCFSGGCNIEGEDDSYDFGSGAGFYVDATTDKWKKNYRMYSYITKEVHSNQLNVRLKCQTCCIVDCSTKPSLMHPIYPPNSLQSLRKKLLEIYGNKMLNEQSEQLH